MPSSRFRKRLIIATVLLGILGVGAFYYSQWWHRVTYLRFLSARCECFRNLGESVKAYAMRHAGRPPPPAEMGAMLTNHCTALPVVGVFKAHPIGKLVCHDVPDLNSDADLILAIEHVSGYGDAIVLYSDGHVSVSPQPSIALEKDAQRRATLGLVPIEQTGG